LTPGGSFPKLLPHKFLGDFMAFQCTVVTPEQQVLDETVTQVILPAHDGQLGILTGHAPVLVKLGTGSLRVDVQGGQHRTFFVDGGVAQMKSNRLTVLTDQATPAAELNAEAAKAEYAEAQAIVPTNDRSRQDRARALKRARAKQALAGRK
jgi:F-type H+-transporting ATPase subunit epsilon